MFDDGVVLATGSVGDDDDVVDDDDDEVESGWKVAVGDRFEEGDILRGGGERESESRDGGGGEGASSTPSPLNRSAFE